MTRWLLVLGLSLLVPLGRAPAQDAATRIDRALKAHGGAALLNRFKARENKARCVLFIANNLPFTQEVYYQAPSQIKEIMYAEIEGKKLTMITALDGERGWIQENGQDKPVDPQTLTELKESAHLARVSRLAVLKEPRYRLSNLPDTNINDRPVFGVLAATKGFRDISLYFDRETFLLTKSIRQTMDLRTKQLAKEESYYSAWKEFNGLKMPTHVEVWRDGKKFMAADALEIKFHERLDDKIFAKP